MDRQTLAREIRNVAKLTGAFTLRSGAVSDTYFDKYRFESDPRLLRSIAEFMMPRLPNDAEVLCGMEMGGIPLATVLSQLSGLPAAFIRKQRKTYGTCQYAEGTSLDGKRIVLIEDVVSSGGAILDAVSMLEADGINVDTAVCVIDRQSGGVEALAQAGVELRAIFTMQEIEGGA
ncbi:MAG: orotate phosphoribosyltransferase [Pseudomonadales bacterium]